MQITFVLDLGDNFEIFLVAFFVAGFLVVVFFTAGFLVAFFVAGFLVVGFFYFFCWLFGFFFCCNLDETNTNGKLINPHLN